MGSSFSKAPLKTANDEEEPMVTSAKRKVCYQYRDLYFACAEQYSNDEALTKCKSERAEYERRCLKSWVKYFDDMHKNQKRVNAQRAKMEKQHELPEAHPLKTED